jgi:hypothetical protein
MMDQPDGGMAAIIAAQMRSFGSMKDNPSNMDSVEPALNPE